MSSQSQSSDAQTGLATRTGHGREIFRLSGNDWFIHDDPSEKLGSQIFNADPTAKGWVPASVPGNIQADLEVAHELTPLWYGEGDPRLWDVALKDWWYVKDFTLPASFAGRRITLNFDGVDFDSEIWLNGTKLGANAGMFRRFWLDATQAAKPGESNRLAVRIKRMPEELLPYLKESDGIMSGAETEFFFVYANNAIRRVLKDLKSPANCSYDWGTNIWTLGIWKDVQIEASGPARIEWTQVQTKLSKEYKHATVIARLEIDSQAAQKVEAHFTVSGAGQTEEKTVQGALKIGKNVIEAEIELPNPALWWPYLHGEQPLYDLDATLEVAGSGEKLDSTRTRFGVREIVWKQVEGAPEDFANPYMLTLNGVSIRTMGSNLVSPDLLFGRNARHGNWFIEMARFGGMNMLRLHGGGVTLPECMYDTADELGIMISHEFPVANCIQEGDAEYCANLDVTVRNIIRQVRNHASIIEYSGGNELNWKGGDDYEALHVMERATATEDNRLFRATCPMQGSRHSPWHYDRRVTYKHYDNQDMNDNLEKNKLMRYGEFGTHTTSNIEVWHREVPLAAQWPIEGYDDPVLVRKNIVAAVFSDEFWLCPAITEDLFGICDDLEAMIKAGQFIGAEGLRYSMDSLRRRGRRLGGFTNWDYNEPWPNGAGSFVIDYDGRTLLNYDFVKQALAPIALNIKQDTILYDAEKGLDVDLWLVSDAAQPAEGVKWSWVARDRRGDVFGKGEGVSSIKPIEAIELGKIQVKPSAKTAFGPLFLELQVRDSKGEILTERIHVFGREGVHGSLSGMIKNHLPDRDDDTEDALKNLGSPANPENLAYIGNGAKKATASGAEVRDHDPIDAINDGKYGPGNVWNSTGPMGWFQIDLNKRATVGRFKLGRDRSGHLMKDRTTDYVKIELSLDGKAWKTVFEKDHLAAIAGFRKPAAHDGAWIPIVDDIAGYLDYRPIWTLEIDVEPTEAQFVKVTINGRPGEMKFAAIDEFEVYAPAKDHKGELPSFRFTDANELTRPVKRTTLAVTAKSIEGYDETEAYELTIKNEGKMTALFVEPHPLLNYRTDVMIENKNISIPPGETRKITIRSTTASAWGLSLAETGWRVTAWNADTVTIDPSSSVLVAFGRQDQMTRGYLGYEQAQAGQKAGKIEVKGRRPCTSQIPYFAAKGQTLSLAFELPEAAGETRLRLHSADRSAQGPVQVTVKVNGTAHKLTLSKGIGLQKQDPMHLAYVESAELSLPKGAFSKGANTVEIVVEGEGWFTWDALDVVSLSA